MKKHTAAQKRLFQNATLTVATRLLFDALSDKYPPQSLNDIVTIFNGQSLKKSDRQDDGLFDVYGSGGFVGNYSEFLSEKPFVVIGRKGSAGKPTYAPFGGWVIDTAYYAQPNNEDALDTKYLYYGLLSIDFSDDIITTAIPGINRTAIYKHTIPIPPLSIQVSINNFMEAVINKTDLPELPDFLNHIPAIIKRVESLAARVNEAQRLHKEANDETEVLLDSAIGKVFTELRAKENKPLKELAIKIGSGSTPKGGRSIYQQKGVPFIRSMNVRMRQFRWSDIAYIDADIHEAMSGTKVKPKDVLLNITGASIGRVACAPSDLVEGNVNQHVAIIRPVESLDSQYLMYWLSQPAVQDFINDEQKGATRQGFTKSQIEKFEIPIISLDEQRRIVAYLDSVQARLASLRELQSQTQEELDALLPSVLDKAFKGEL